MSYIRTHNITKTLLIILLGLPFVLGVFSNVRPAPQASIVNAASAVPTGHQTKLFQHISVNRG